MSWLHICAVLSLNIVQLLSAAVISENTASKTCHSEGCKLRSKRILDYMDATVDPCEDFYMFACGNFVKRDLGDQIQESAFTQASDTLNERINGLLAKPVSPNEPKPVQDAKKIYEKCIKEGPRDPRKNDPILQTLEQEGLLKMWPCGNKYDKSSFSIEWAEILLHKIPLGGNSLFKIAITVDPYNTTRRVLEISQPELVSKKLSMDLNHTNEVNVYKTFMLSMIHSLCDNFFRALLDTNEIVLFEKDLSEIIDESEDKGKEYNIIELLEEIDEINWKLILNNILPKSINVKMDESILLVKNLSYLKRLQKLLAGTNHRTIAYYMLWHTIFKLNLLKSKQFDVIPILGTVTNTYEFNKDVTEKTCAQMVTYSLPLAVTYLYASKYISVNSKEAVITMTTNINKMLTNDIGEKDWMDKRTRHQLKAKARNIVYHIAYPDEILDKDTIENHYKGLNLNKKYTFDILVEVIRWQEDLELKNFRKPINRLQWDIIGDSVWLTINAFYVPELNSIFIPGAVIQAPLFVPDVPNYVNYASLGFILGHELTHGFDDQGVQYDALGNLNENRSNNSKKSFKEKEQCFVRQYSQFTDDQLQITIDGEETLGENIADNGGLKMAYYAYHKVANQLKSPELKLPGLQRYTNKQLFMISAANLWCMNTNNDANVINQVKNDVHTTAQFRVNGPLMNLPDFTHIFSCPLGSGMNPKKKCEIWY